MSQKAVKWGSYALIAVDSSTRPRMHRDASQKRWIGERQAFAEIKIVTEDCLPAQIIRTGASLGA